MMGKHRDGGYAEFVVMPGRSLCRLPAEISFEAGAIMMCSAATAFHALKKAKLEPGQSVAVFGLGGLGFSAVQLARALGANAVYGVDIKRSKLGWDRKLGFTAVNAAEVEPATEIRAKTGGRGVDVALELIGLPLTMRQAVSSLAIQGRAALAGITDKPLELDTYKDILGREAEIVGVSDHLAAELPMLIDFARQGKLQLDSAISRVIPLDAHEINRTLDRLENFADEFRVVIAP
jgi:propanol-preferring alcohol dehydrogenase